MCFCSLVTVNHGCESIWSASFYVMKNTQVCCCCKHWINSCLATLQFRATQARNTSWTKRKPESTIWVIEYLCVYPKPIVGLTLRSPPPPGSFSTMTCAMGKLKPQQISQTGIFTSPLHNPITPTALKPPCACVWVCMCVTGLNLLQTANQYNLLLRMSNQQWRAGNQPISTGLSNDWTCHLMTFQVNHTNIYWIALETPSIAALGWLVWITNAE